MNIEEHSEETAEEDSEINSDAVSKSSSESDSQSDSEMGFKEITDDGYNARNYRCEASVSLGGSQREEHIIGLWPLHRIEPRSGVEVTCGEQFVRPLVFPSPSFHNEGKTTDNVPA